MAKKKIDYDWAPFLEAYKALPLEKQIYADAIPKYYPNIEALVQKNADDFHTPLHLAAECGLVDICRYYIEKGIPVDVMTDWSFTPLHCAAYKANYGCRYDVCRFLLDQGADPLIPTRSMGLTPFHVVSRYAGDKLQRLFLERTREVNITFPISKGETPFLGAASSASPDVLKIYLEYGGDVKHINNDGDSALHRAAWSQSIEKCKLILDAGADLYIAGKRGKTVLHKVAAAQSDERDRLEPVLRFLIVEKGMQVDIVDKQNNTPLHYAAENCRPNTIKVLLELGANINAVNKNKETVLHRVTKSFGSNRSDMCILLLSLGADPRMKNSKGKTPLDLAKADLANLKDMVKPLEKAMKQWEGKPETVARKPGKAAESKPAKKKVAGVVPLKKAITLPTIFNLNLKPDLSLSTKLEQLHEMLGTTLPDYDIFVTKYGKGIVNYVIRVYPPDQVIKELPETRNGWSEYQLWDAEDSKLDDDDLAWAIPLADSIEGDVFAYYPGSDEDKSKKKGIYILPRHTFAIKYVGKDLGDVFKYARKLFSDFPKDDLIFEGYNDISYQEYIVGEVPKPFDEMATLLRKTGKYDHEIMQKGKYLTLCSTKLGGIVDFDFEGKKVFIRCNKGSDTSKIHDALVKLGFEQTVKDKMLYQG